MLFTLPKLKLVEIQQGKGEQWSGRKRQNIMTREQLIRTQGLGCSNMSLCISECCQTESYCQWNLKPLCSLSLLN